MRQKQSIHFPYKFTSFVSFIFIQFNLLTVAWGLQSVTQKTLSPVKVMSELRDWAGLPEDLLHSIITLLGSFPDLLAFAATCHPWSSAFSSYSSKSTLYKTFPPLLLDPDVPFCSPRPLKNVTRNISLPKQPCYVTDLASQDTSLCSQIPLLSISYGNNHRPGALDKFAFRGASFGQMIFSSNKTCFLFDVFAGIHVSPPPLPIDEKTEIYGAVLTGPLSSSNSHLIVSTTGSGSSNFFWRVGSNIWSECSPHNGTLTQFVVFKGQAFGMGSDRRLFKVHLTPQIHLEEIEVSWAEINSRTTLHNPWLVVCGDMLLLVGCNSFFPMTGDVFEAYCLDTSTEHKWVKVDKLEKWAIFISPDFRVQPLSCLNPERWGGRSSSLYCYDSVPGLVAFELGKPLQQDAFIFLQLYKRVPPTWVVPSIFSPCCDDQ